jgi:hypothetical protein
MLMIFTYSNGQSQHYSSYPWEKAYEEWLSNEDDADQLSEDQYEFLQDIYCHKIDINHASQEELEQLPFLSAQQVEDIEEYLFRYGEMKSGGELQMIESIDAVTRQLLTQFITFDFDPVSNRRPIDSIFVKKKGLAGLLQGAKQDFVVTGKIPTYKRRGDKLGPNEGGYLGWQWKHSWRYTLSAPSGWKIAFIGAKDSGEPFFRDGNGQGWDFYSGYLLYKSNRRYPGQSFRRPYLREIVLGRYRLRTGMGLVINRNQRYGKTSMLQSLGRGYGSLVGHSSRSEANYLQGAAATIRIYEHGRTNLELTPFFSWRKLDATLDTLESGEKVIVNLQTSGYHRTQREMARKNNASSWVAGGNVNLRHGRWHVGVSGLWTTFSESLKPRETNYYRWAPHGSSFWNLSVDYGYTSSRVNIGGETATGDCGAVATVNSISLMLGSKLEAVAVQRMYSYRFYSLLGNSYSSGGKTQNESGLYVGLLWRPIYGMTVSGYADIAYYPWARYKAAKASHERDGMVDVRYEHKAWTMTARCRLRRQQQNAASEDAEEKKLVWSDEWRWRLSTQYHPQNWMARLQLDGSHVVKEGESSNGWMATAQGGWQGRILSLWGGVSYFNTDNYQSRLYCYERGLLYSMSIPMSYGKGVRYSIVASANLGKHLMVNLKVATVDYMDRDHIASGMQQIDGSAMTDIELQMRVRW